MECHRQDSRKRKRAAKRRRVEMHEELIAWLRSFEGPGSNGTNEAADVLESVLNENAQLRDSIAALTKVHSDG